ncbi:MAG: hypothetical protein J07HR59_00757 [Halorubrum sp. J07HR59]|nr:MAG: hypothetical protein J07HR59_00757 [Halorubrum sp. J07HR59]
MRILPDLLCVDDDRQVQAVTPRDYSQQMSLKGRGYYSLNPLLRLTVHQPIITLESHRDLTVLNWAEMWID